MQKFLIKAQLSYHAFDLLKHLLYCALRLWEPNCQKSSSFQMQIILFKHFYATDAQTTFAILYIIQLSGEQKRCLSFPILLLKNRFGLNSVFNFAQLQMEINQYIDSVILFILIEFLVDDTTSFIWNAWTCCLTFFSFFIQKVMIATKSATTPNKCRKNFTPLSVSLYTTAKHNYL